MTTLDAEPQLLPQSLPEQQKYADGRTIGDADSHIMETGDWLAGYCDEAVRPLLRPLSEPILALIRAAEEEQRQPGARAKSEAEIITTKGWKALGALDPSDRSRALDVLGFDEQLVFATFSLYQFFESTDLDVLYGGADGHNRGIVDFCSHDARLLPVAFLPLIDPERAERSLERSLADGAKAVMLQSVPAGDRAPSHPDLDRIWARLQDANVPFVLHVGGGGTLLDPAYKNNGLPFTDLHGGGESLNGRGFMAIHHSPEIFLSSMILDGLFDRFPRLRGGVIEQGASWVVDWMRRLDHAQHSFGRMDPVIGGLQEKASSYVRRHLTFTPFTQEPLAQMIAAAGPELFMFSTDFPHPEGGMDPIGAFEAQLGDTPDEAREAFWSGNFQRLMHG